MSNFGIRFFLTFFSYGSIIKLVITNAIHLNNASIIILLIKYKIIIHMKKIYKKGGIWKIKKI